MAQRKRFLIVDDIPLMRSMLAKYVERAAPEVFEDGSALSIEIVEAGDGEEALEHLQSQPIDLVFLDLMMPRMDGIAFLRKKASDPSMHSVPVVVCSAVNDPDTLAEAHSLGAFACIEKPFTLRDVEQQLRNTVPVL